MAGLLKLSSMDKPTIGIIASSGDLFARELFAALADRYHIEHLQGPDPYVDLLWCDWADQALVQLTRGPLHQPLIARLHSYEICLVRHRGAGEFEYSLMSERTGMPLGWSYSVQRLPSLPDDDEEDFGA